MTLFPVDQTVQEDRIYTSIICLPLSQQPLCSLTSFLPLALWIDVQSPPYFD